MTTFKALATTLFVTSLLAGCAATDPYTPESDKDFIYDNDMSFAMNVIDGSLGFHNGLRDANRPVDADTSPGAMDYLADGVIGFGGGGGFGGAFLSMLGTNQGNAPLHTYYEIVYYPVESRSKENIKSAIDKIENELIAVALETRELDYVRTEINDKHARKVKFSGKSCEVYISNWKDRGFKMNDDGTCDFMWYQAPKLLKFSDQAPNGSKGLFAVIGLERFFAATYLTLELDEKYYSFSPVMRGRTKFPFVSNGKKVHLFIKPNKEETQSYLTIEGLTNIDPWISKHYQGNSAL
ncbi:hypothetical protein ACRWQL_00605 (plasmid) [Shewanella sp. HL-SH4]|uniref:hypothetical protein n=1 Tax=Shewanella sp. HL-SH4 TaxID=3436240 RepID=UPI003EBA531C